MFLLGGIPELRPQALRAVVQPLVQKLLWGGDSLFFDTLAQCRFFFDSLHRPSRCQVRGLRGHHLVQLVLGKMIHERHDGAAALDEPTPGVHVGDVGELVV
jgi:hypothetical protein